MDHPISILHQKIGVVRRRWALVEHITIQYPHKKYVYCYSFAPSIKHLTFHQFIITRSRILNFYHWNNTSQSIIHEGQIQYKFSH